MNTTTFVFDLSAQTAPAPTPRRIALGTHLASFARRMYARARHAGYFKPVRVVVRIQLPHRQRHAEPYENPEFV